MKGLIGRKVGMTHLYRPTGDRVAVTVIEAGPCVVTQQKTVDSDGYEAVQLAFAPVLDAATAAELQPEQRERRIAKRVNKPQRRHFDKAGVDAHRVMREIRVDDASGFEVGSVLTAELFVQGELVDVVGTSKGRGFAGVMKRHGFKGQKASHGAKIHRKPASAGATDAARVFKGQKGPGHYGAARITTQNLIVEMVDAERHVIAVRGAVPGPRGGLVMVLGEE